MTFDLSERANAALMHEGRVMVLGGPGSGKTTLSLLRAQRFLTTMEPGQQALFLSFSRAAVRQVLVRTQDVLSAGERALISVQTYHAFCMALLRAHGRLLNGKPARVLFPDREKVAKADFGDGWDKEITRLANEEGIFAFDTFAEGAARLLSTFPRVAELAADRFPFIILDEFQDTSDSQWALVKELSKRSELMVLADPEQRIFEYDDRVDPARLDHVRAAFEPTEFDLQGENHRSPDAGILQFADALLQNRTLPETSDVKVYPVYPNQLEATTHAVARFLYAELKKKGIRRPSIAILARSNSLISDISNWLSRPRTYNKIELKPVPHDVLWDAELSAAAAQIIASILEWPLHEEGHAVATTLEQIARYYEIKNAVSSKPIKSALTTRDSYLANAASLRAGKAVRPTAAKALVSARAEGLEFVGSPMKDWVEARKVLIAASGLEEIVQAARFIRLFGATDEIGSRLSEQWDRLGNYGNAMALVRRTLDQGRLVSESRDPQGWVLMNIHKSKGKEFDGVILVEGQFSGAFFTEREEAPHVATRRLLRVAITRARHTVVIVRPKFAPPLVSPPE